MLHQLVLVRDFGLFFLHSRIAFFFLVLSWIFCSLQSCDEIEDLCRNAPAYEVGDSDKGAFSSDAILAQYLLSISAGVVMPRR